MSERIDVGLIGFRPLQHDDLGLMHRWLNEGESGRWYGQEPATPSQVAARYEPYIDGREPTHGFLVLYGAEPIGYIQTYRLVDYPEYNHLIEADEHAAGIDQFIGEADYLHRGLGTALIVKFLREVVFAGTDVTRCVPGPEPGNRAAIRSYEKAGFRYWKTIQVPGEPEPEYLMQIERGEVAD
jgi:aminoglycoside 6'-N-acetyltransferase